MACCLMAQGHYLNKCCLIISKVLWNSSEGIESEDTNQENKIENCILKSAPRAPTELMLAKKQTALVNVGMKTI